MIGSGWHCQFPLRAKGRIIVNQSGKRFKFAGVNWFGASDVFHVVGGLDVRSLQDICDAVAAMGFTVVRLPFSNEMLRMTSFGSDNAINYELNPSLQGLTPLQVFDEVIQALGKANVAVVVNNHTTKGMWSAGADINGLWYMPGDLEHTEDQWISDWVTVVRRYSDSPHVVGYDLRNEVRPSSLLASAGVFSYPTWNSESEKGGDLDWARAASRCAQAVASEGAGLIIVERVCWPQAGLQSMLHPETPWDLLGIPRDRLVLSVHAYAWSGPGAWSPKAFLPGVVSWVFVGADYLSNKSLYGEMEHSVLEQQLDLEWGFCLDQDLCPVWLSEFGANVEQDFDRAWFEKMCLYLECKDVDFAYWPLNVGPKPGSNENEAYGLLTNDWQPRWWDARVQALRRLCPDSSKAQPAPPLPVKGSFASPAMAPHPWCAPLPGPLVSWNEGVAFFRKLPRAKFLWHEQVGYEPEQGGGSAMWVSDLEAAKKECVGQGFGGFVFRDNYAYMCNLPSKELRTRATPSKVPLTSLFTVEEIRLCAVWSSSTANEPTDEDPGFGALLLMMGEEQAVHEVCKKTCERDGYLGFGLLKKQPGFVRFFFDCLPQETGSGNNESPVHMLDRFPVCVGLERFPLQDAFPGSDSRMIWSANLAECRQICLEEGFGGFAMYGGYSFFRTASPEVLRVNLVPAGATDFYVLTVEPLISEESVSGGQVAARTKTFSKLWDPGPFTDSSNSDDNATGDTVYTEAASGGAI